MSCYCNVPIKMVPLFQYADCIFKKMCNSFKQNEMYRSFMSFSVFSCCSDPHNFWEKVSSLLGIIAYWCRTKFQS